MRDLERVVGIEQRLPFLLSAITGAGLHDESKYNIPRVVPREGHSWLDFL